MEKKDKFKKDLITIVDYSKYVSYICATICVLIFQFVSLPICITLALAFYFVAFSLSFISLLIKTIDLFKVGDYVKEQNASIKINKEQENEIEEKGINGEKVEVVHLKTEKFWHLFGTIAIGLFALFTFVVLVLY